MTGKYDEKASKETMGDKCNIKIQNVIMPNVMAPEREFLFLRFIAAKEKRRKN